jgi:hypothetical protein
MLKITFFVTNHKTDCHEKIILLLRLFVLLMALSFSFLSCEDNSKEVCETCESTNFKFKDIIIAENHFKLKEFVGDNGGKFMFAPDDNPEPLANIYEEFRRRNVNNIDYSKIAGVVLYVDKSFADEPVYSLSYEDLKHVAFYVKENDKQMIFKVYTQKKNRFTFRESLSASTEFIASKDITYMMSLLFDDDSNTSCISFYNSENLLVSNKKSSELRTKILSHLSSEKKLKMIGDCGTPCDDARNEDCHVKYSEDTGSPLPFYYCSEPVCPKDDTEEQMQTDPHASSVYDLVSIDDKLHAFRDDYLYMYGGQDVVDLYYGLSGKLDKTQLTLSFCTTTFDLIVSDIIPITEDLTSNPYSSNVLIDSTRSVKILNYLHAAKNIMVDQAAKDRVDVIIVKLNEFTNKSNNYITTHLAL